MTKILLIGFMGSGKSTVGKELGKMLKVDFYDIDAEIEKQEKMSVAEIFAIEGEEYFRQRERDVLVSLSTKERAVVASGGGVVISARTDELKLYDVVIFLHATADDILKRTSGSDRPLLNVPNKEDEIDRLLEQRQHLYESAADIIIQTTSKSVKEVCKEILEFM